MVSSIENQGNERNIDSYHGYEDVEFDNNVQNKAKDDDFDEDDEPIVKRVVSKRERIILWND